MLAQRKRETVRRDPRQEGCSTITPRCRDARSYSADLRPCCRGHIKKMVADIVEVFGNRGVTYWADYGTLLGAVRNPMVGLEPGIIPHDKDADLGILYAEWKKAALAVRDLQGKGYPVLFKPWKHKFKVRLSAWNHTNVDVFGWRETPAGKFYRVAYIHVDQFKGREFDRAQMFPLTTVQWEGMTLSAPNDPAAFCEFRYGPKWRTPIRANHDGVRR